MPEIEYKIKRLNEKGTPRVLDLFAGCGGLSLGFHAAGYQLAAAMEIDPHAACSHATNFYKHEHPDIFERHAQPRDITAINPQELIGQFTDTPHRRAIDVIIGGPPCQAFARVGRAKLREIAEHPEAFLQDPRGNLYLKYIEYVRELKPLALLMENVPDVLNYGGHNIPEEMCELLENMGYTCAYTLLNSVHYGVPEMRERAFLLAYSNKLDVSQVTFPKPTHHHILPPGYHGSRQVALKYINGSGHRQLSLTGDAPDTFRFCPPPYVPDSLSAAITAKEATSDLPRITLHLEGKLKRGARRFNELIPYTNGVRLNSYAKLMRNWPGFENNEGLYDHVIRYLPRDYAIFARMNPGDQYPEAHQHAQALFAERLADAETKAKKTIRPDTEEYKKLWKETVPPYDPGKFPNKWRKMEADEPARTLLAHLGKDGYSHIHYDSTQARTISVREAARLQSFPDGFVFCGSMNPAFRQIGNAVPPLMAKALGDHIMSTLIGEKHE